MSVKELWKSGLAIGLWLSLGHLAFAQTAAITGTVRDQSGAVVTGAQVTATQKSTNERRQLRRCSGHSGI